MPIDIIVVVEFVRNVKNWIPLKHNILGTSVDKKKKKRHEYNYGIF